jgi:membrane protease YdiL (CAAX protease family)
MSAETTPKYRELPLTHAALALALLAAGLFAGSRLVPALRHWPYNLLAPLAAYLLIASAVAPLRRSLNWARVGRLDRTAWAAAAAVVLVSSSALVVWYRLARPDVSDLVAEVLRLGLPTLLVTGVVFAALNALLEEVLFRGLLFDALRASHGDIAALIIQAGVFGAFHVLGFPSGAVGVALAAVYGLMQGGLRLYTGGLALCWLTHVCADATIFVLLVRDGS